MTDDCLAELPRPEITLAGHSTVRAAYLVAAACDRWLAARGLLVSQADLIHGECQAALSRREHNAAARRRRAAELQELPSLS